MRETDWLEPFDEDAAAPRRPGPLLIGLASLPWLLVAALLLLPGRGGADPAPPEPADVPADDVAPSPEGGAVPRPTVPRDANDRTTDPAAGAEADSLALVETRGRWRVEPGVEEAVGLAVIAARGWLTGVDPVLELAGLAPPEQTYAEHLVVEAVEQPASDAVVVTLIAIVLTPEAQQRASPAVRRLAVPVALTSTGPRIAGAPWDLPPPDLEPIVLPREPVDEAGELQAAHDALVDAGLGDRQLVALHRTSGWPVIAETTVTGSSAPQEVWLRRHLDGFVVSGTTLAGDVHARAPTPPEPDVGSDRDADTDPGLERDTPTDTPRGDAP